MFPFSAATWANLVKLNGVRGHLPEELEEEKEKLEAQKQLGKIMDWQYLSNRYA